MTRAGVAAAVVLAAIGVFPGVAATQRACAAGEVRVAFVIDYANAAGSPGGVSSVCVGVADRATGADVLAARAAQLDVPSPTYRNDGLLCSIDGFPASGCGGITATRFWSYWLGTDSWTYSSSGPAFRRANANTVEGWRWVDGQPEDKALPPAASPSAGAICTAAPPPPSTTIAPPGDNRTPPPKSNGGPAPTQPATDAIPYPPQGLTQSSSSTPESTTMTTTSAPPTVSAANTSADFAAGATNQVTATVAGDSGGTSLGQVAGFVGGAAVIAMVAVGGLWLAKRRQASGPEP